VTIVGAVLSLLAIEAIGLAVLSLACREPAVWPASARLGLGFALGLIALGLGLFALSWIGFPPTPGLGAAFVAVSVAAAIFARGPRALLGRRIPRKAPDSSDGPLDRRLTTAALVVLAGLCATAGLTSLLEPVVEWDVMAIWALKAKVLLHEPLRSAPYFQDPTKAYSHLDYPLLWPMAMAWTWCGARADDLQSVKVLSPALLAALAAVTFGLLRRATARLEAALLATVAMGLPMVLSQSSRLLADAPLSCFTLAAFAGCHLWLETGNDDDLRVAGLFSAGMLFTKNEGLALSAILLASVSCFLLARRRARALPLAAAWLGGVPLLLTGAWFVFRAGIPKLHEDYGSRIHPEHLVENASRIPTILANAPRYLADFQDWSLFWPVFAIVVVLTAGRWVRTTASFLVLSVGAILLCYGYVLVVSPWNLDLLMVTTTGRLGLQIAPLCVYVLAVCARESGLARVPDSP
jgi:hypothetical protein